MRKYKLFKTVWGQYYLKKRVFIFFWVNVTACGLESGNEIVRYFDTKKEALEWARKRTMSI